MMAKLPRIFISLLLASFTFTTAYATSPPPSKETIQKAYYAWCSAIGTAKGNSAVMTKFYAPNAILLPTLSHEILTNRNGGLDGYFSMLTKKPGIKCSTDKLITRIHGGSVINTGLYTFTYQDNDEIETLPARFTFIYQKFGDKWLIIKHHSSKLPS